MKFGCKLSVFMVQSAGMNFEVIPMHIGNLQVNGMMVLAPMAGVTDWAYRTLCAELGASVTVTEMQMPKRKKTRT